MTANAQEGDRDRCLAAGMDGYLTKPINSKLLMAELAKLTADRPPAVGLESPADNENPEAAAQPPEEQSIVEVDELWRRVDGDAEFLAETIAMFAEDYPRLVEQIAAATTAGDRHAAAKAAHTLKGMVANFCAPRATAAVVDLEAQLKMGDATRAAAALVTARAELIALSTALSQISPPA